MGQNRTFKIKRVKITQLKTRQSKLQLTLLFMGKLLTCAFNVQVNESKKRNIVL